MEDGTVQQSLLEMDFKIMKDLQIHKQPEAVTRTRDITTIINEANENVTRKQPTIPFLTTLINPKKKKNNLKKRRKRKHDENQVTLIEKWNIKQTFKKTDKKHPPQKTQ